MRELQFIATIAFSALLLPLRAALAAGPYVVDDGGIVDPKMIQIESWYSHSNKGENIGAIDAAYQLLPHAEFSLQETYDAMTADESNILSLQVKYQWWEGNEIRNVVGSAVLGVNYADDEQRSSLYAYVPLTVTINDIVDVNLNIGWNHPWEEGKHFLTWGIGAQLNATGSFSFVGEVFGKNEGRSGLQAGLRAALSKYWAFDAVYGCNITGTVGNWLTAGVTAVF
jgi:hypothetical protein